MHEAHRFAATEIVPLRSVGDVEGVRYADSAVKMPTGWCELYRTWTSGGWGTISGPAAYGGQQLPAALSLAVLELWNFGSMAFGIGVTLTMGAVEAIAAHASRDLKERYLPKLVSGEWMGTMNLTEPQAGSDLGAISARALPHEDGSYRLFGQKIFITFGEHDLTENIIHLVLARLPGAPKGTRGLSLFLVPKFLLDESGAPTIRNDAVCIRIERKLGLHASPTCTMLFGDGKGKSTAAGAIGWLIGKPNEGLSCMFTMMNNARLAVGIQGVAVAEAAYRMAHQYALERRQGRLTFGASSEDVVIACHPDVRRNLATMKALTAAARALCYSCASSMDLAAGDQNAHASRARADLLTPIAKAFATDVGIEVSSIGVQVHGGMGFIEETGAAQLYRDARIAPIYEGTNGIQALDFVLRKMPRQEGEAFQSLMKEVKTTAVEVESVDKNAAAELFAAADYALASAGFIQSELADQHRRSGALFAATPFLRLVAITISGGLLARVALKCSKADTRATFVYFADNVLSEAATLQTQIFAAARALRRQQPVRVVAAHPA